MVNEKTASSSCCPPTADACWLPGVAFENRPALTESEADDLSALFKTLASNTRLRLVFALAKAGEMCVSDLATALAMKPQAVCNQLQRLVDLGSLASKRRGNNVYYRIIDPCIASLLDRGLCLMDMAREREGGPQVSSDPAIPVPQR